MQLGAGSPKCATVDDGSQTALADRSNKVTLSGILAFANVLFVGSGCGRCNVVALAKFARVVANFVRKDTKPPQKPKANVDISPTCESEIALGEPDLNSCM